MTLEQPLYAHLLRRAPSQVRSVERVDAILDAAAALLVDREPDGVAIRDLADRAGVPTGTIYQFFDDKDAVLHALAVRYIAGFPDVLTQVATRHPPDWTTTLDSIVDAYTRLIRRHPAVRRLWLSGTLTSEARALEARTDTAIAAAIGERLQREAGTDGGHESQWRFLVTLIDGFLHHAFAVDARGDATTLREGKRAARAYAAAVLGVVVAPP